MDQERISFFESLFEIEIPRRETLLLGEQDRVPETDPHAFVDE
jgi:hypothetical protein